MNKSQDRFTTCVGLVVLLGLGYGVYRIGAWVYHLYRPAPAISMAVSAWFEPGTAGAAPQFRVAGQVLENGKAVAQDRVRLTVEDSKKGVRQSVFVDVKDGRFELGDQPAFRGLTPEGWQRVRAEYEKGGVAAAEEVYLGERTLRWSAQTGLIVAAVALLFTLGFFYLFTGEARPGKNTWAIIISYLVMFVFLAVPLALPSVISVTSPDLIAAMRETPVGVLAANPGKGDLGPQWVLNIGGVVTPASPAAKTEAGPAAAGAATAAPETAQPTPANDAPPQTLPPAAPTEPALAAPPASSAETVAIQGGLVIPLYVLILSVIGAAINMTRKLPDFQLEATNLPPMLGQVSQALCAVVDAARSPVQALTRMAAGAPPAEGQPEAAEKQAETKEDAEGLIEKTAQWRKGLITQHMYLLSAPFLGIIVYYMLAWLQLLQQASLVIVSFSVGLMSDKIVARILGIAGGILAGSPEKKTGRDVQPQEN